MQANAGFEVSRLHCFISFTPRKVCEEFQPMSTNVIMLLYKSMIWSHLECCVQLWEPHLKKDSVELEKVQEKEKNYISLHKADYVSNFPQVKNSQIL